MYHRFLTCAILLLITPFPTSRYLSPINDREGIIFLNHAIENNDRTMIIGAIMSLVDEKLDTYLGGPRTGPYRIIWAESSIDLNKIDIENLNRIVWELYSGIREQSNFTEGYSALRHSVDGDIVTFYCICKVYGL